MRDHFDEKIYRMAAGENMPVPEELHMRVDDIIKKQGGASGRRRVRWLTLPSAAVLAAALVLVFSVTVSAAVSMYQRRMEEMNREKLEEYFAQVYGSTIPADTYSRSMTEAEKERFAGLEAAYRNEGLFPEGEIRLLDSRDDYSGKGIGYYAASGVFYLPEAEMSDEELLQLIDFRYKRDYSIQQINGMMEAGELDEADVLDGIGKRDDVTGPSFTEQETIIPYTGSLSITAAAAGDDCVYIAGRNEIHRMETGESSSQVFYDGFESDTWIKCMFQAQDGRLYAAVSQEKENGIYTAGILVLDPDGNKVREIDLSKYCEDPKAQSYILRMAVDPEGYIYLQGANLGASANLLVLDPEGTRAAAIDPNAAVSDDEERFTTDPRDGICVGVDGKVYVWFQQGDKKGVASVDRAEGTFDEVYYIDYDGTYGQMDVIAEVSGGRFIFWGYDGMYTWSLGDERAQCVYKTYEKNYGLDGVLSCASGDGRILVVDCIEMETLAEPAGGQAYLRIPEKTVFYYEAAVK